MKIIPKEREILNEAIVFGYVGGTVEEHPFHLAGFYVASKYVAPNERILSKTERITIITAEASEQVVAFASAVHFKSLQELLSYGIPAVYINQILTADELAQFKFPSIDQMIAKFVVPMKFVIQEMLNAKKRRYQTNISELPKEEFEKYLRKNFITPIIRARDTSDKHLFYALSERFLQITTGTKYERRAVDILTLITNETITVARNGQANIPRSSIDSILESGSGNANEKGTTEITLPPGYTFIKGPPGTN